MPRSLEQRRRAGDLPALKIEVWYAILGAAEIRDDPESTPEMKLRACNAIGQIGNTYLAMLKADTIDQRLDVLEKFMEEARGQR